MRAAPVRDSPVQCWGICAALVYCQDWGEMTEKFCLRWNDFEANISTALQELRDDKDFFDVTVACEDDQLQAHKVILSACSPFFRAVLKRNPHPHPLLYLKGVNYRELVSILNFMYHGEVNIAQEELNSFLAVAEELQVKGLTQHNSNKPKARPPPDLNHTPPPKLAKRPRPPPQAPAVEQGREEEVQEVQVQPVKCEPHAGEGEVWQEVGEGGALQQYVEEPGEAGEQYGEYGEYGEEYGGFQAGGVDPTQDNKGEEAD